MYLRVCVCVCMCYLVAFAKAIQNLGTCQRHWKCCCKWWTRKIVTCVFLTFQFFRINEKGINFWNFWFYNNSAYIFVLKNYKNWIKKKFSYMKMQKFIRKINFSWVFSPQPLLMWAFDQKNWENPGFFFIFCFL